MFSSGSPGQTWSANDEERSLALLARLIFGEIDATANAEQKRAMLVAIGARLAGFIRVDDTTDLERLGQQANALWDKLKWGSAGFEMHDTGIDIIHRGLPLESADQLENWPELLPPILEGAYGRWFGQLNDGNDRLRTYVLSVRSGEVEIRHGL
ncbi:hypothetical protein D6851_00985 [Altericroceibacterium spongiae]|uniref:Cellulose synthase n=1 Tax=Altericroceibacterium spongiae TaxID=2320269 RepID=A0A420ER00_9SPHN|nr:cellulose biosynthesis protein BcsD [Altericroceibacterium spongiae]RKF23105.1 hypothetical protein D6851_00985 [Altericroceibacterium spongiae]